MKNWTYEHVPHALTSVDIGRIFRLCKAAGIPLDSIAQPDHEHLVFVLTQESDAAVEQQIQNIIDGYDRAAIDTAEEALRAARRNDFRPLKQAAVWITELDEDTALLSGATAGQVKDILEHTLTRQRALICIIARMAERELRDIL